VAVETGPQRIAVEQSDGHAVTPFFTGRLGIGLYKNLDDASCSEWTPEAKSCHEIEFDASDVTTAEQISTIAVHWQEVTRNH